MSYLFLLLSSLFITMTYGNPLNPLRMGQFTISENILIYCGDMMESERQHIHQLILTLALAPSKEHVESDPIPDAENPINTAKEELIKKLDSSLVNLIEDKKIISIRVLPENTKFIVNDNTYFCSL